MSNSAIVLLCIEILILIFFMGITHNSEFRKKLLNLKFKINSKFKLNLKAEEPSVKRIAYKILSKIYFSIIPSQMQILSNLFSIHFRGNSRIWSNKRNIFRNKKNIKMPPFS